MPIQIIDAPAPSGVAARKHRRFDKSAIVLLALAVLSGCVQSTGTEEVRPVPEESVVTTEEPSPTESAIEEVVVDPDSQENKAYFVLSSTGQILDMNKDLDDAVRRAENSQLIRLSGNILELTFNLGQLKALDAPTAVATDWQDALLKLEASLDSISGVLSAFLSDEATLSEMLNEIERIRSLTNDLIPIVERVE